MSPRAGDVAFAGMATGSCATSSLVSFSPFSFSRPVNVDLLPATNHSLHG
jgi:hypothetical protein